LGKRDLPKSGRGTGKRRDAEDRIAKGLREDGGRELLKEVKSTHQLGEEKGDPRKRKLKALKRTKKKNKKKPRVGVGSTGGKRRKPLKEKGY